MSGLWSENAALFKRLMKISLYLPILYYGFNEYDHTYPLLRILVCLIQRVSLMYSLTIPSPPPPQHTHFQSPFKGKVQ